MLELPGLKRGVLHCRLPLSGMAAEALTAALLTEDLADRRQLLAGALAADPALALWACAAARPGVAAQLGSIPLLAAWLAERLHALLVPAVANERVPEQVPAGRAATFARLAEESAAAGSNDLAAVSSRAGQWLAVACEADSGAALEQFLPQGLPPGMSKNSPAWNAHKWRDDGGRLGARLYRLVAVLARLERLDNEFGRQLEREKIEAVKELAYGAGHEINNPLANISARAQTLLKEERDPERRRKLAAINTQAFRAYEMIADLMLFARPPALVPETFDVHALLVEVLGGLAERAHGQQTELSASAPGEPLPIEADRNQLAVAVRALVTNALEALGRGGQVEVQAALVELPSVDTAGATAPAVAITVSDTGPGIDDETRRRLFDPYFSGREAGRGLGMGLCKCWSIASGHGGSIDVEPRPAGGTTVRITLPLRPVASTQTEHPATR